MTYLPYIYKVEKSYWTLPETALIDESNAGNVIFIPDYITELPVPVIPTYSGYLATSYYGNPPIDPGWLYAGFLSFNPTDLFDGGETIAFSDCYISELIEGLTYYVVDVKSDYIAISTTPDGEPINFETDNQFTKYVPKPLIKRLYAYETAHHIPYNKIGVAPYPGYTGSVADFEIDQQVVFTRSNFPAVFNPFDSYYVVWKDDVQGELQLSTTIGGTPVEWTATEDDTLEMTGYGDEYITPIIKNNVGVAAVGIIATCSGYEGFINAQYPTITREFPLVSSNTSGTLIVQDGWVVDFAQDLMTPSPVASYGVNKDVFNFNDNDDKRKLATRVVVRGKDINGISISVSLIGIRAYDNDRQFYNGCTYISRKSEGYIYKNSYNTDLTFDCTAIPGSVVDYTVDFPSSNKTKITVGASGFYAGSQVSFTNPPSPLVNGTVYYIVDHVGNYITVAATPGGSAISMNYMTYTLNEAWSISTLPFAGTITVYIHGAYAHAVSVLAGSGRAACLLICAAFGAGFTDADGNIWTCEVDPVYGRITFHAKCENSTSTYLVNFNMGVTGGSFSQYSIGKTIWASTLHASDVAMMQVDNSTGWFTKNMQLQFSASSMPTGLDPAATYTVGSESVISPTFKFFVNDYSGVVNFTTAGSDVICFKPNSIHNPDENGNAAIWLYGWNYVITDGSELTLSIPGGTAIPFTSVGVPIETIDINGVMCTTVHIESWPTIDYGGNRGYLMNQRLYVNKKSDVIAGSDLTLRFGEEPIEIDASNCGTDPVYGDYLHVMYPLDRITSASKKCYPHGVGCLVMYPDGYDLDNPETDSPVALHGERVSDVTVDNNITYGYLDGYATALLLGSGTLYKKATCFGPITRVYVKRVGEMLRNGDETIQELSRITPPRVGDNIEIVDSYGATPVVWEVMSVTIKHDQGIVELILGDYEMNPITSMIKQTNGINRTLT
jgi:hypothetical protein